MRKDEFAIVQEIKMMGKYEILKEIKEEMEEIPTIKNPMGCEIIHKSAEEMREGYLNLIKRKIKELEAEAEKDV